MLVEDDSNDVALTQRAFARVQFANPLQVVTDGEQAIAYLAGESSYADRQRYPLPILILLDLKLPRKSGFDVLGWIDPIFGKVDREEVLGRARLIGDRDRLAAK